MKTFSAPWSRLLKGMSVLVTVLCLGLVAAGALQRNRPVMGAQTFLWLQAVPIVLMIGCALLTVRGYAITPEAVFVKRLLWNTRLPRTGLDSAAVVPEAMKGSIRLFGNGGFYSFTGLFRSRELGNYRAFVTDGARTVVLRYASRTIVISPGDPIGFVQELTGS